MNYHFDSSLNEIGNLATGIFKFDFDSSTGDISVGYISGWLHNNIGELNVLIHSCYSGGNPGMQVEEKAIYRQVFLKNYYTKLGRQALMGVSTSSSSSISSGSGSIVTSEWTELRDGDSYIRRQAMLASPATKVTASRTYSTFAENAEYNLKDLLQRYTSFRGGPRQVAGKDAPA
tara:strand:+ start:4421 stop:4945 length:525 start_codon:yes stop_codon:yes gene_type:complete